MTNKKLFYGYVIFDVTQNLLLTETMYWTGIDKTHGYVFSEEDLENKVKTLSKKDSWETMPVYKQEATYNPENGEVCIIGRLEPLWDVVVP